MTTLRRPRHYLEERGKINKEFLWHPTQPRLAIARDNGNIAIWDLTKIDRELTKLGLGFGAASSETNP